MTAKRRIFIAAAVALALVLASAIGVFAYFTAIVNADKTFGVDSSDTTVEIGSYAQLYQYSASTVYNDGTGASTAENRVTLKLTADIALGDDIFISKDVHLDLGGKTLDLNGKTLTLTHGYSGSTVISGGTVDLYSEEKKAADGTVTPASPGMLVFDTPNSTVIIDGITYVDATGANIADASAYVKLLWQDATDANADKYNAYNALWNLANVLVAEYDPRPSRLTYSEVAALATLDMSSVLGVRESCALCADKCECTYVYSDIDLPRAYLDTAVTYTYTSSNETVLSVAGNVTPAASVTGTELGITVTSGSTTVTDSLTVHVYDPDVESDSLIVAEAMFYATISDHKRGNLYVFNRSMHLPLAIGDSTFSYNVYSKDDASASLSGAFTPLTDGYVVNFEPTVEAVLLKATITGKADTEKVIEVPMISGNTGLITTNASTAMNVVELWYENSEFVINPIIDSGVRTGYTSHILIQASDSLYNQYGITSVTYELMNNTNGVYEIAQTPGGLTLRVVPGKHPGDYVQDVFVNCIFVFDDSKGMASEEQIQVPITYDDSESGDNVNGFLPYYTYYNDILYGTYAGSTSTSFEVAFCYGTSGPIICYDTLMYNSDGETESGFPTFLRVSLYYNGEKQHLFTYDAKTSMTVLLDEYLEDNGLTLQDIIDAGDAKWVYEIDKATSPSTNTQIELVYNYKMDVTYTAWATYPNTETPITSSMTLLGILHLGTDVPDEGLYAWIYNSFNITGDTYVSYDDGDFVVTDWLKQNVTIDITAAGSTFPKEVESFKGMEYLLGTMYLDLSGHTSLQDAATADEAAKVISKMTSLETLKLSNNAFRDREGGAGADLGTVSALTALPNLRYLYLDGNNIYSFEWLKDMTSLLEVYVHSNTFGGLESVFYGSLGLVNLQMFQDLTDRGVMVYNDFSGGNIILFEESAEVNDYVRLRSIEYQKKLASGVSIETLYETLSTNAADYGLSNSYTDAAGTTVATNVRHTISFGYDTSVGAENATYFVLTDTITTNETTVVVTVRFEIIRF